MANSKATPELNVTGRQAVPEAVEPDLANENAANYHFAALLAGGRDVRDVGCGTGILIAAAIGSDAHFLVAAASALPVAASSLDLLTAFTVVGHVDWREFLVEASRALSPNGILLVPIPERKNSPPQFEFELEAFRQELGRVFSCVQVLRQNDAAHFVVAICSKKGVEIPSFDLVTPPGRLLREREDQIHSLQNEIQQTRLEYANLLSANRRLDSEVQEQSDWVRHLDRELRASDLEIFRRSEEQLKLARENGVLRTQAEDLQSALETVKHSFWLRLGHLIDFGPWTEGRFHLKRLDRLLVRLRCGIVRLGGGIRCWFESRIAKPSLVAWRPIWHVAKSVYVLFLLVAVAVIFAVEDICFQLFGKRNLPVESEVSNKSASVIIANWNGRTLLENFLPSVMAGLSASQDNEIIVVDNGSSDNSAEFVRANFPGIRVLEMDRNLGFGGGTNAGISAAKNDVIVLLNNDMEVEPDFLAPLLKPFEDPLVFAVASQIFLADRSKQREETGLTEVWWEKGFLRPGHRIDPEIKVPYPCAYAGGGSSAFDRRKLIELGGFDPLFEPFYYEDTDLGFLAWKRGWKVLYQPASVVHHCHRATVEKTFSAAFIQNVLNKNAMAFCWKNIHNWRMLAQHLAVCFFDCLPRKQRLPSQVSHENVMSLFLHMRAATQSRWLALSKAAVSDQEALNRPSGGYFRDRFIAKLSPAPERLKVLFVSPFPMEPPVHGGGVLMKQTVTNLAILADVHLVCFLDNEHQLESQQPLRQICKSAHFVVRPIISRVFWTLTPFPVRQFYNRNFLWLLHRTLLLEEIDVMQLEYTMLGQYAGGFQHIPSLLFEHDISTQTLKRGLKRSKITFENLLEYFRMRWYEPRSLAKVARVQVCSQANAEYLRLLAPKIKKIDSDMRAAIDPRRYGDMKCQRDLTTLLFVGGFNHLPNVDGLQWFITEVFDSVIKVRPDVVLEIVGSNPPESNNWRCHPNIRLIGAVPDVRVPLQQAGVFICPILVGSGIRVKLLEAFASGIPVVSTSIGAEGLTTKSGALCEIADTPEAFSQSVLLLLDDDAHRDGLIYRARKMVEYSYDSRAAIARLEKSYRTEVLTVRPKADGVRRSASA